MTDLLPAGTDAETAHAPAETPAAARRTILVYAAVIIVAVSFINPSVGVFVIPVSFVLKNKLHLSANGLAEFGLYASVPGYFCFAFGIVRDFWNPFRLGDRGYFILFGALSALIFTVVAFVHVSETMLLASSIVAALAYLFLWAAWNGFASTISREHAMSGQMSAVWNLANTSTIVVALILGGAISDRLETMNTDLAVRTLFLGVALIMLAIMGLGFWKPRAVFAGLHGAIPERRDPVADLARLARHWPIYPALLIWLLWNFSPGTLTVLQYYMSNSLHATDAQWGEYNAISFAAAVPTFALFGFLSPKFSLRTLLWLGAALGCPQMVPLLFAHSAEGILIAAVPCGLLGGIATAAYLDLIIRSCPKGLEGTMMMMAWSMYVLSVAVGNFLGTDLYDHYGGFLTCVAATTIVYALILPVIPFIPKALIASADSAEG